MAQFLSRMFQNIGQYSGKTGNFDGGDRDYFIDHDDSLGSAVGVGGVDDSVVDVDGGRKVSAGADGDDERAELEGAGLGSAAEADT